MQRLQTTPSTPPATTTFVQYAIAKALAKGKPYEATVIAEEKGWTRAAGIIRATSQMPTFDFMLKTGVDPGAVASAPWAGALVQYNAMASEFLALLRPREIMSQMSGLRIVPFLIRFPRQTGGAQVTWLNENIPIPASALLFESDTLGFNKCAALIALDSELVKLATPAATGLVQAELLAAVAQFLNSQFADPAVAAVAGTNPESITHGTVPFVSSGSTAALLYADFALMIQSLATANIPCTNLYFIMRPSVAAALSCKTTTQGAAAFPALSVSGGRLAGVPVITSNNVPGSVSGGDIIILADASQILVGDQSILTIDASAEAAIQLVDNPATGAQNLTSLWQQGAFAWKVVAYRSWRRANDSAVVYLDDVHL